MPSDLIKPMKAPSKSAHMLMDLEKLAFPLLASYKVDGFRASVQGSVLYTSGLKPVPNAFARSLFGRSILNGLDGELVVGEPVGPDVFSRTSSGVTAREGKPEVRFYVFDSFADLAAPFTERVKRAEKIVKAAKVHRVVVLEQFRIDNLQELLTLERCALEAGYEGLMLRSLDGPYKPGPNRATVREGSLLKLKRFEDSEAEIIELIEGATNTNDAKRDELGRQKRSTSKAGKVANGTLGVMIGRDLKTGAIIKIGPGVMKHEERDELWAIPVLAMGRIARYKFFPTGTKDAPRFPTFTGWRDASDMTE